MSSIPLTTFRAPSPAAQEPNPFLTEDPPPPSPKHNQAHVDPFLHIQYPGSPYAPSGANATTTDLTQDKDKDPTFEHEVSLITPPWRKSLFLLLERPTSSPQAFLTHVFITFLIVFSALVTVLETVPAFHSIEGRVWFGVETALVVLFTFEYVGRCVAWSGMGFVRLLRWIVSFFGIIDLLAVMPYYIELMLGQDTSVLFRFSILRMFRLLRVFRPFRYNSTVLLTIEVMYLSVRRSQHALLAIGFFVSMVLTVFSTLLYFAERGTWDENLGTFINIDGDPTQFQSIPAAAWFVLVTITTVGYGEITPRSFLGRLVTLPLLVFGLLLITLPSFVLGREFSIVWDRMSKAQRKEIENEIDKEVENSRVHRMGNGHAVGSTPGPSIPADNDAGINFVVGDDEDSEDERKGGRGSSAMTYPPSRGLIPNLRHSYTHLPTNPPPDEEELESQMPARSRAKSKSTSKVYSLSQGHLPMSSTSTFPPPSLQQHHNRAVATGHSRVSRDLSNRKLAMNQTELSKQISELRETVEVQGRLLERLLKVIEERELGAEVGRSVDKGKGKQRAP
ncbi:hypothetical protein AX16_008500 [Volvariella volvacea WC 439]|nr:hypothetical protein AX16_008500 [Volvariella volvacea WC 439]